MTYTDISSPRKDRALRPFSKRELAWAAILFETAQSDKVVKTIEVQTVAGILKRKFRLSEADAIRLCERHSRDSRRVSARVNTAHALHFLRDEEVNEIQEVMWEVARADNYVAEEEEVFIASASLALSKAV